jgi:hemerythrin
MTNKKKIEWDESISVNNKKMDNQHKVLIDIFNNLLAYDQSHDPKYISEILEELESYIEIHLKEEEELMHQIHYPEYDFHCELHNSFTKAIKRLKFQVKEGNLSAIGKETAQILEDWFLNHIKTEDQQYGKFIKQLSKK